MSDVLMNFGKAIEAMKHGNKVCRRGWNGKNMFIYFVEAIVVPILDSHNELYELSGLTFQTHENVLIRDHINMKAADGSVVVGWLASQTDMLSEDWELF